MNQHLCIFCSSIYRYIFTYLPTYLTSIHGSIHIYIPPTHRLLASRSDHIPTYSYTYSINPSTATFHLKPLTTLVNVFAFNLPLDAKASIHTISVADVYVFYLSFAHRNWYRRGGEEGIVEVVGSVFICEKSVTNSTDNNSGSSNTLNKPSLEKSLFFVRAVDKHTHFFWGSQFFFSLFNRSIEKSRET